MCIAESLTVHTWEGPLVEHAIVFAHDLLIEEAQSCAQKVPACVSTGSRKLTAYSLSCCNLLLSLRCTVEALCPVPDCTLACCYSTRIANAQRLAAGCGSSRQLHILDTCNTTRMSSGAPSHTHHVSISRPQRTAVLAIVSANRLFALLSLLKFLPRLLLSLSADFGS